MEYVPGNLYNFHPGSHVKQGVEIGIDYITQMLNEVLKPEQTTKVLLETMAGKGSEIGRSFEELRAIIDRVELNDHLGVCLDTCHVYDAGYDIVNDLDGVLKQLMRLLALTDCMPFISTIQRIRLKAIKTAMKRLVRVQSERKPLNGLSTTRC